ncbi:MAG: hypothetical protein RIQ68_153 [Pseudomonadota bacterium]
MRLLPIETASAITGTLVRWLAPLSRRHQRVIDQLKFAYPEKSDEELASLAQQSWDTMGRVFAESFRLDEILQSDRVVIEDFDAVHARVAQCDGFVACTAHQGNWEIAAVSLAKMGIKTAGIYRRLKNPLVDANVRQQRLVLYPDGLLQKQHSTALTATKYVKGGGALSVMADLRERRGPKVPFFGHPAPSNPFPAMIAVTLNKPVFIAHVMREPGVRFKIAVSEIEVAHSGDRDADILETTARIQAALEKNIRMRPGEWMWSLARWI